MNTRREFLKSLLGVALVAPAVTACRSIAPEPVVLPAERRDADRFRYVGSSTGRMSQKKTCGPVEFIECYADGSMAYFCDGEMVWKEWPKQKRTWHPRYIEEEEAKAMLADYRRRYAKHAAVFPDHAILPHGKWTGPNYGYARGPQPWTNTAKYVK